MAEPTEGELNQLALLALFGLSDHPEQTIAKLLRSNCEIRPEVRALLANAFEARRGSLPLAFNGKSVAKAGRAVSRWEIRIEQGRAIERRIASMGYSKAIKAVADETHCSQKTAEAAYTASRKADKWLKSRSKDGLQWPRQAYDHVFATALANSPHGTDEDALFATADSFVEEISG